MTSKVYVVTDLGPGDGGKGGVVHKIVNMTLGVVKAKRVHTVIKWGGAQGSHGVRTSNGETFAFSQWGCGTLEGVPTHISEHMVAAPEGLLNEADALRYQCGVYNPFDLLTVDERALCATPFDGIASRVKELALGDQPRGTIGTGVGQAYRRFREDPSAAITAKDLTSPRLRELLAFNRELVQTELQHIIEYEYRSEDRATLAEEVRWLYSDEFFERVVQRFIEAGERTRVVSGEFFSEAILAQEGVAVVESSHGVLTDRVVGFHPHTSAIRTLPRFKHDMLRRAGFEEQIVDIGVTRAYAIRHGAGPIPTANPELAERLLPGSNKDENRWQGKVRVGPFDAVLHRYALEACGGPAAFDGLAITWFDQVQANGVWDVCNGYANAHDQQYFLPSGEIRFESDPSRERQAALTQKLLECQPRTESISLDPHASRDDLYGLCADVMSERLEVQVRMVSFGPTELDKLCK